jgi:hypothetical protein
MPTLKKIELENEDGRVVITRWTGSITDKKYTTIETHGDLDLEFVKKAIAIFEGKENA